jgi:O-antigen/teichoic acid export membrane protein
VFLLFIGFNGMLGLCDFGISQTLSRETSLAEGGGKEIRKKMLFSAAKSLNRRLSVGCFVISAPLVFWYFMGITSPLDHPELKISILIFLVSALLRLLANPYLASIYGSKNVKQERNLRSVSTIMSFLFLIVALCFVKTLLIFTLTFLVQSASLFLLAFWKAQVKTNAYTKIRKHRQYLLGQGGRLFMIYLGGYFIFQINAPIVAHYLTATAAVSFMPPFQAITILMTLAMLGQSSLFPFISSIFAKQGIKALQQPTLIFLKFNVLALVCILFYLNFFGDLIFAIWLGPQYHLNHLLLLLLSIMIVLQIQQDTLASVVMSCGYIKFALIPVWAGGALNILFLIFLLPRYGVVGAGWAVFLGQLLTSNWYVVLISLKFLKITLRQFVFEYAAPIILCCIILFSFLEMSKKFLYITHIPPIILLGGVFGAFSFVLFWYILLTPGEREIMRLLITRGFK